MNQQNQAIAGEAQPPVARRVPKDVSVHEDKRIDSYHWLRDRDDPEVVRYLEKENAYAEAALKPLEPLQRALYEEYIGRIKETDSSVLEKHDDYYYCTRTEVGRQYEIHCRRHGTLTAPEEIILDENELAEGHSYFSVGAFVLSPDHKLLAYSVDTSGDESHVLYIKNLETGELIDEPIPNTYYGVEWANDSRILFYTTLDDSMRPHELFRHTLGAPAASDVLVYREKDDAFFLSISKTKSRRFLIMSLGSNTTTEEHFLEANDAFGDFHLIEPRRAKMEYHTAHHGENFLILTNDKARNFRLMETPVTKPSRDNWREVIAHRNAVKLDDVDVFRDHFVVFERTDGLKRIRIVDAASGEHHYIEFDESVYTLWASANPEFESDVLRFNYMSLVMPRTVIDYNMNSREREVMKRYEVPGGYDPEDYVSERIFAAAHDGTKIPVSIVYRKGLKRDGSAPVFLYGYGSYGASIEPHFESTRVSLLDRGLVFAIAHVRGGGEMGRQWYDRGKLLNKRNTFTDFIACAQHLIDKGYTSKGRIACCCGSAGGLLLGAVVNMKPELWCVMVANVPFVDVINTMLDETIPLTVIEYEEWGDPRDKKFYEYIKSYSPYDNVVAQNYPAMLVTAGLNDPRVQFWEPAKWVAKLRARKTDNNLLLLQTKMSEGHSGASGRYNHLREIALQRAFILHCLGIHV